MYRPSSLKSSKPLGLAVAVGSLAACASTGFPEPTDDSAETAPTVRTSEQLGFHRKPSGRRLFSEPFQATNGRSCATCHVLSENTTLTPENVAERLRNDPDDPLFHPLDADDSTAAVLTFEHLKKGLVRVILPLPDNMDVIDFEGNVITPPDRTIFVWRGVPSVADTAITAPYQLDGRAATLQEQAQAAITSHSQGGIVPTAQLDRIAEFQQSLFTSPRARFVAAWLAYGVPVEQIPVPEKLMRLSPREQRGRELYQAACAPCHGGATTDKIVDREVHDFFFPELKPDGNVRFDMVPGVGPVPRTIPRPGVEILNTGYGIATYFGQIGLVPAFNDSVEMPRYRFRFYEDSTRSKLKVDLPPVPVTVSGDPLDPRPALDADGAPIVGPNLVPQLFTTDPDRAAISGDPADFEAFDMPQLRGIARTAPYFHDNSHATLKDVIDAYSRFVLSFVPALELPRVHPPEQPGGRSESLSVSEKEDLTAFLERL